MGFRRPKLLDKAERRDEAGAAIDALRPDLRRMNLRLARHFHDVNINYHYVYESCANIREYGEKHGYSSRETGTLVGVGEAVTLNPDIEERLLEGRITLDAAAALGRIFSDPNLIKDGEDWLLKAELLQLSQLQREIKARLIEVNEGGPSSRMDVVMTSEDREKFERARQIACKETGKVLDEGRTIGVLSEHYLDSFDPDRVKEGKRRAGETAKTQGRYIPESVKREVRKRSGGVCQWPRCNNRIWRNFAHRTPHARGGSREAANLLDLCWQHHVMFDAGRIRVEGPSDDPVFYEQVPGRNGHAIWRKVTGVRGPPD